MVKTILAQKTEHLQSVMEKFVKMVVFSDGYAAQYKSKLVKMVVFSDGCAAQYKSKFVNSAGSIPDSYDIYRYLNLVRYSIFDTRYFRRKLAQNI